MWSGSRWRRVFSWGFLLLGWAWLHGFWRQEVGNLTGEARWVWVTAELERPYPTRGVFVATFAVAEPGPGALLKVAADREYVAWVNNVPAACGWSRPGFRLDVYGISHLLRPGENRVRIEVRSPTPVGGLLASVDLPGQKTNAVVTGRDFLLETREGPVPPPVVWGSPPRYPWSFPRAFSRPRTLDQLLVEEPVAFGPPTPMGPKTYLYRLETPVFGYVVVHPEESGWVWYAAGANGEDLAALKERLQPFLGAPEVLLDPEPRWVSQVLVVAKGKPRAVEVWPVAEPFRARAPGVVPGKHAPLPRTRWSYRNPPE
ncbi:hypothetical protein EG19_06930 [Thermoanaerobaculum aquaticum]|uniref:Uncharacterized protein n=1 Tax=Thermoanaerobaculum aquaticum TaxID=1312852 RepID=A0A062XUY9_9BACT|nr:hypothetical protein [Thermoanaerobaculum aquaticum]KDA53214.1 hypothetical protein EG19_06930 [Thermoanaerobaculum aquaticum]